jgi:hypothetical protein
LEQLELLQIICCAGKKEAEEASLYERKDAEGNTGIKRNTARSHLKGIIWRKRYHSNTETNR